jgi:small-conductance mechanosensitive channel
MVPGASALGLTPFQARVAGSIVALALTGAVAFVVVPAVIRRAAELVSRSVSDDVVADIGGPGAYHAVVRTTVRAIQLPLLGGAALGLLGLWGQTGLAVAGVDVAVAFVPTLVRATATVLLLSGAYLGTRLLDRRLVSYADESDAISEHQRGVAYRVTQVVVFIATALAALSLWNFDPGGLLLGAGFLGIVVGMAARQTLGSLIAGFVLMFSRPFEIGDWVVIGDHEGTVTDITIINTRIRNFDGETVVLPNDLASNQTVVNRSDQDRLRLRLPVGIDYGADVEHAEAVVEGVFEEIDAVLSAPAPQVIPTEFSDSAVTLELRFWIDRPSAHRKWQTRARVLRETKTALEDAGVTIPFPQRELSDRAEDGGSGLRESGRRQEVDAGDGAP